MELGLNEKRKKLKKKILYLKHQMAKYFNSDDKFIKFSDPIYKTDRYKVNVELTLINSETSTLSKLYTTTYYFDFAGEYIKREGIWYEGQSFSYDELNDFFKLISMEIKELK